MPCCPTCPCAPWRCWRSARTSSTSLSAHRTIFKRQWRRPRVRIHPRPSVVGLRASYPGQYLHIDITVIKLLDGTTAYIQAIIDNFSRLILATCSLRATKTAAETAALIRQARSIVGTDGPGATIIADDGGENTPDNIDVAAALNGRRYVDAHRAGRHPLLELHDRKILVVHEAQLLVHAKARLDHRTAPVRRFLRRTSTTPSFLTTPSKGRRPWRCSAAMAPTSPSSSRASASRLGRSA